MSRVDAAGRDVRADAHTAAAVEPTDFQLGLLADIEAGKVADDAVGTVWLDLGTGEHPGIVSEAVWEMERAPRRWVHQLDGELRWRLTYRGRDVIQGRPSDG